MANRRLEPVNYRKFRADPMLSDGLLAVERDDGGVQRRVAAALDRIGARAGQLGDQLAEQEGAAAGLRDALANAPAGASIEGGLPEPMAASGGAALAPSGQAHDVAKAILRQEEGFRPSPYWDVNAYRTGYGSDTITRADGTVARVRQGMSVTREDAERDLARRLGQFEARARNQVGRNAWSALPEAARGALLSVTYNYGSLPRSVVAAAKTGDANRIAGAVGGLSANRARRGREAAIISSAFTGGAPAPQGAAAAVTNLGTTDQTPAAEPSAAPAAADIDISSGGAGGFRPTGGWTIRDRAYDQAGTRTYLEQLDATMRADIDAVFARFGEDPIALDNAFSALQTVQRQDHVFPEIVADYDSAFQRMTQPYRRQAQADLRRRQEIDTRLEFLQRTTDFEEGKARLIERFDASNEDAGAALASAQQSVDAHYDSAVARGVMDADDAFRAKAQSKREAAVGFYTKQGASLASPEDVAALRETMRQDFTEGTLEGVDANGWNLIEAALTRQESAKRTEGKQAAAALKDRGDQLAGLIASGVEPGSEVLGKFMLDAKTAPGGSAIVEDAFERIGAARIIREKSLDDADKYVRGLEADPKAITSGAADFARKELTRMETDVKRDPIGVAVAKGILPEDEPIVADGADPDAIAGRVRARVVKAETAAEHFGVEPKYLRPGEASAIKSLAEQDPAAAAQLAGGLISGAGQRAGALLAELGDEAPAIMQAGAILAGGGSPMAARDVIAGHGKGPDGKDYPAIKFDVRNQVADETLGDAFVGAPADGHRTIDAAHAIARARAVQLGIDPKSDDAKPIFERALQEASGAIFEKGIQYGGIVDVKRSTGFLSSQTSRTIIPPTIRADRFGELIEAIRDQDLQPQDISKSRPGARPYFSAAPVRANGKPYTAADIKASRPVAVSGGYRFAAGDPASDDPQWIRGADGRPFVLALDSMRRILEARVPGAYR